MRPIPLATCSKATRSVSEGRTCSAARPLLTLRVTIDACTANEQRASNGSPEPSDAGPKPPIIGSATINNCLPKHTAPRKHHRAPPRHPRAFTLMEVILSLAILTGAIAVLGELARIGLDNADYTHKLTTAQLLCETKMAEITSEITLPDPVSGVSFESEMTGETASMIDPDEPTWLYSIESDLIDENGLLQITVTVYQDLPEEKRPVTCSLVRWMVDSSLTGTEDDYFGDSSSGSI